MGTRSHSSRKKPRNLRRIFRRMKRKGLDVFKCHPLVYAFIIGLPKVVEEVSA